MELTQHRISSFGDLLDLWKQGSKTGLQSIEFDLSVGHRSDASTHLDIGHPLDLLQREKRNQTPIPAEEFFDQLSTVGINEIVIDIKARGFNKAKFQNDAGQPIADAEFFVGDQEKLYQELPALLKTYQEQARERTGRESRIVIASVFPEFFLPEGEVAAHSAAFFQDLLKLGVATRFFARTFDAKDSEKDVSKKRKIDPFAEANRLGVTQIGIELPKQNLGEYLRWLKTLPQYEQYREFISFYTVDDKTDLTEIQKEFPRAEVITNKSFALEEISNNSTEQEKRREDDAVRQKEVAPFTVKNPEWKTRFN
ncbi:MAG: hypothetical protein HYV32_00490 [Candidatus Kerfeldbacteria bacterium]|nr:hypothetical protein [Candidatus Kerfeldbacteria bacterium]